MLDFNLIAEFSRTNCVAICAVLVPANLLATLQTMIFAGQQSDRRQVQWMVSFASFYAVLMVLHVYTWFSVGVVMAPTYILLSLGTVCLGINLCAITYPAPFIQLVQFLSAVLLKVRLNRSSFWVVGEKISN